MIDYSPFIKDLASHKKLKALVENISSYCEKNLSLQRYGDLKDWYRSMAELPDIHDSSLEINDIVSIKNDSISTEQSEKIDQCFQALIPWRKGPFQIFNTYIDTEWRSDWKWNRLLPHISNLKNRTVLDVGCGNGYHCFRMFGGGARRVVGIDPSPRFIVQFYMLKKYIDNCPVDILPAGIQELPDNLEAFDTTFSMGVLYHRRSPIDHIMQLKNTLNKGGELVLETLIIDGDEHDVFVPSGRYAMMNNVWFLPSAKALIKWLEKSGFKNVRCVDVNTTSIKEQRKTEWMKFHSLEDFLDKDNHGLTVEGYPAPKRAIFIANK